jgi:hypothetical protein
MDWPARNSTSCPRSAAVDVRLADHAKAAATSRVDSELEVIRTEARAVLSAYQRQVAYSNAQAAFGRLYNSIGLDVIPPEGGTDLRSLTAAIERSLADWHRMTFERAQAAGVSLPPVAVLIEGVEDLPRRDAVRSGIVVGLQRQGITVNDSPDGWRLVVRVVGAGGRGEQYVNRRPAAQAAETRTYWAMSLVRPNGTRAGATAYSAALPGGATSQALMLYSQAAVESTSLALSNMLSPSDANVAQNEANSRVQ